MKKVFSTLALAIFFSLAALASSSMRPDIEQSFYTEFVRAANVNVVTHSNYTEVGFTEGSESKVAYYDQAGELIGVSKPVLFEELPLYVKRAFAKNNYGAKGSFNIVKAHQFITGSEEAYFMTATNGKDTITLQASNGIVSLFSK